MSKKLKKHGYAERLKYNVCHNQILVWRNTVKTYGYDALAITRPRGRPPKNDMGRPRKKKPEEMTELERLRYENECLRGRECSVKKSESLSRRKRSPSQRDWAKAIQELRQEHDLEILLEKTGMARSTYYYHTKRLSEPDGYDDARSAIRKIYDHHKGLILHSDQGWHYHHLRYQKALKDRNIVQSMSRKGNCLNNAMMENFFGLMKSELLYLQEWDSVEQFAKELVKYIRYYNNDRIKLRLNGKSPVQYRALFQSKRSS